MDSKVIHVSRPEECTWMINIIVLLTLWEGYSK